MQFRVNRPFRLGDAVRMPGQIIELDITAAARLRSMGLIGQIAPERAVIMPGEKAVQTKREKAVKSPGETRRGRPSKKQEKTPIESAEENIEDGAETDNTAGD